MATSEMRSDRFLARPLAVSEVATRMKAKEKHARAFARLDTAALFQS